MPKSLDDLHVGFRMHAMLTMRRKGDWLVMQNPQGRIIDCNSRVAEELGYSPETFVGMPLLNIIPERHRQDHLRSMQRLRAGEPSRIAGKTLALHALDAEDKEHRVWLSVVHYNIEGDGIYSVGAMTARPFIDKRRIMTPTLVAALIIAFAIIGINRYAIDQMHGAMGAARNEMATVSDAITSLGGEPTLADSKPKLDEIKQKMNNAIRLLDEVLDTGEQ